MFFKADSRMEKNTSVPNVGFATFTIGAAQLKGDTTGAGEQRLVALAEYVTGVKNFLALHIKTSKSCLYAKMRSRCDQLQRSVVLD